MKRTHVVVPMLLLGIAACSDTNSPGISIDDQRSAAVISASDATVEVVSMLLASDLSLGGGASTIVGGASLLRLGAPTASFAEWSLSNDCPYDAGTGRFVCAPVTNGAMTLVRDFAFADANGGAQSAYDAATTASANFHLAVSGVHTGSAGQDTVSRSRSMTVSGLAGAETSRTWNGTGTRSDGGFRQENGVTRTYHTNDAVTFDNILVSLPRAMHRWPMSGTITRHVDGTGSVTRADRSRSFSVSKTVTVTFDGTQYAAVSVDGVSYTLDLQTGAYTKN